MIIMIIEKIIDALRKEKVSMIYQWRCFKAMIKAGQL